MYNELVMGFTFGVFGYLVAVVLTQPGEILANLPSVIQRLNGTMTWDWGKKKNCALVKNPMEWNAFQHWSNKITWNCGKCIAGFWALIYSLISLPVGQGFTCVVLAIFTAHAIERWLN